MKAQTVLPKFKRTPEQIAEHKKVREYFQRERPTMEQLLATGDYEGPISHGLHMELRIRMSELKKA